ncbi:ATP-binding protein [Bacteroides thetaiotaomicron]|nr:ATP-binding protein [Bacteroides thetaiotaomicron]
MSVKDSGRGIPKEMKDKIFDSYFQRKKRIIEKASDWGYLSRSH